MSLLSSKSRGRPRPRARRRTEAGVQPELQNKGVVVPAAKSDQSFRNKENGRRGGDVGKGKR